MVNIEVTKAIERWAGEALVDSRPLGGGSICDARLIVLASGRRLFLKTGAAGSDMFLKEANGLRELRKAKVIRVPEVMLADAAFLLLEFIPPGRPGKGFFEGFGRRFAALHRQTSDSFGFYEDNYIGATPQKNPPDNGDAADWAQFYWRNRLLDQFRLAEKNGYATPELTQLFKQLESRIETILAGSEAPPALLHGDLWSGNFLVDEASAPVLIDPAVYYGHREADLAMTRLFGGFEPAFYGAYQEAFPLSEGWQYRENIYKLYHVLNHLNLFGRSYYRQSVALIKSYLDS